MLDKKINPASWTCPIAKGNVDSVLNTIWCINDENNVHDVNMG